VQLGSGEGSTWQPVDFSALQTEDGFQPVVFKEDEIPWGFSERSYGYGQMIRRHDFGEQALLPREGGLSSEDFLSQRYGMPRWFGRMIDGVRGLSDTQVMGAGFPGVAAAVGAEWADPRQLGHTLGNLADAAMGGLELIKNTVLPLHQRANLTLQYRLAEQLGYIGSEQGGAPDAFNALASISERVAGYEMDPKVVRNAYLDWFHGGSGEATTKDRLAEPLALVLGVPAFIGREMLGFVRDPRHKILNEPFTLAAAAVPAGKVGLKAATMAKMARDLYRPPKPIQTIPAVQMREAYVVNEVLSPSRIIVDTANLPAEYIDTWVMHNQILAKKAGGAPAVTAELRKLTSQIDSVTQEGLSSPGGIKGFGEFRAEEVARRAAVDHAIKGELGPEYAGVYEMNPSETQLVHPGRVSAKSFRRIESPVATDGNGVGGSSVASGYRPGYPVRYLGAGKTGHALIETPGGLIQEIPATPQTVTPMGLRIPSVFSKYYDAAFRRGINLETPGAHFARTRQWARDLASQEIILKQAANFRQPLHKNARARFHADVERLLPEDTMIHELAKGFDIVDNPEAFDILSAQKGAIGASVRVAQRRFMDWGTPSILKLMEIGEQRFRSAVDITFARKVLEPLGFIPTERGVKPALRGAKAKAFREGPLLEMAEPNKALAERFQTLQREGFFEGMSERQRIDAIAGLLKVKPEVAEAMYEFRKLSDTIGMWEVARNSNPMLPGDFVVDYLSEYVRTGGQHARAVSANVPSARHWYWLHDRLAGVKHAEKIARDPVATFQHYASSVAAREYMEPARLSAEAAYDVMNQGMQLGRRTNQRPAKGMQVEYVPTETPSGRSLRRLLREQNVERGDTLRVEAYNREAEVVTFKQVTKSGLVTDTFDLNLSKAADPMITLQEFRAIFTPKEIEGFQRYTQNAFQGNNRFGRGMRKQLIDHMKLEPEVADTVARMHVSLLYGTFLGGKLGSVFKNLTQGITMGGPGLVGPTAYAEGLRFAGTPEGQSLLRITGLQNARIAEAYHPNSSAIGGVAGVTINKAVQGLLSGFSMADRMNRLGTVAGAYQKVMMEGTKFRPNLPYENWNAQITKYLKAGNHEKAATIYAIGADVSTQYWYSRLNRPNFLANQDMMAMFSVWPLNYFEYWAGGWRNAAKRWKTGESHGHLIVKDPSVMNAMRYSLASYAIMQGANAALDADIGDWFFLGPLQGEPFGIRNLLSAQTALSGTGQMLATPWETDPYLAREVGDAWADIFQLMVPIPGSGAVRNYLGALDLSHLGYDTQAIAATMLGKGTVSDFEKEKRALLPKPHQPRRGR
jgi:hypothetical protein